MVLVLFANTNFKMYLLKVLSLIQELRINVSVSVSMSGSGAVGLGVGVGSYQPGVYVPLKALFLVLASLKRDNTISTSGKADFENLKFLHNTCILSVPSSFYGKGGWGGAGKPGENHRDDHDSAIMSHVLTDTQWIRIPGHYGNL